MKDKNGVLLKTGDLMAEVTGGGSWDGKTFSSVKLWEYQQKTCYQCSIKTRRSNKCFNLTSEGVLY